ncbi:MAG: hypothetical protein HRF49_10335 [bacterium]|jgi:hypothetical protein
MERCSRLIFLALAGLAFLLASCNEGGAGFVTVKSGTAKMPGQAKTSSGLEVTIANWAGGIVTISDFLEDDAAQIAPFGDRVIAGKGFIWIPGGSTTTETVFKFPVSGYANGATLDLYFFDVENQRWISFAGVEAVVTDNLAIVTFPNGASGLGGNFAVLD